MTLPVIYNLFVKEINSTSENVAVVVFTCKPVRESIVYDVTGVDDIDEAVLASVRSLSSCCNYKYNFIQKVGNVYFFN